MRKFHIEYAEDNPVNDHYPLTRDEVVELLEQAIQIQQEGGQDVSNDLSSILVRLNQGIPGLESPRQYDGPIAQKEALVIESYIDWIETYPTQVDAQIVDVLMSQFE